MISKARQPRKPFEIRVGLVLQNSILYKNNIHINGAFFYKQTNKFFVNVKILSNRLNFKPNTVNADLRKHGIKRCKPSPPLPINLPDARNWKLFEHPDPKFSYTNIYNGNIPTTKWERKDKTIDEAFEISDEDSVDEMDFNYERNSDIFSSFAGCS